MFISIQVNNYAIAPQSLWGLRRARIYTYSTRARQLDTARPARKRRGGRPQQHPPLKLPRAVFRPRDGFASSAVSADGSK